MATGKFNSVIKIIEQENRTDQDLHDNAHKVFSNHDVASVRKTLQGGIDRRNEAIAILVKAEAEIELEWFHSFFEDGFSATRCSDEGSARYRLDQVGGYILTRPKPEPYTVIDSKAVISGRALPHGPNEY